MAYKSEEEFLAHYDPNEFDRPSVTTDILLVSISDEAPTNYRKSKKKSMSILLVKRCDYPFKDKWCLPGGFLRMDEELEDAPKRILATETNLHDIYLEQLYTFGGVYRDPRMRVLSASYIALIDKNRLPEKIHESAKWFDLDYLEEDDHVKVYLSSDEENFSFEIKKILQEKTTDRYHFEIVSNDSLAFDHPLIVWSGIERLKNKISYTDIVFNMMPEYFTLGELQRVYEVILHKKLLDPAFRRIIADKVEKTNLMETGAGHRPSYLYRYKMRRRD